MYISEALDYVKEICESSTCHDTKVTLEDIYRVICRASTKDALRWSKKIKDVVAYVNAGNYSYTSAATVRLLNRKTYLTNSKER